MITNILKTSGVTFLYCPKCGHTTLFRRYDLSDWYCTECKNTINEEEQLNNDNKTQKKPWI